ncbi:MAG: transposase [Ferruginibacter sp.]|nr:transposase [Ferruginibacter sp.]
MSRKYKFWYSNNMYFIRFATVNWKDVFTRNEYKDELIKSWQHCQQKKRLAKYAWCIMPSHIHMIISSNDKLLEDIVRDMKSHTSSLLKMLIKEHPQESRRKWMVWMFERAGKMNGNISSWQFWQQHIHILLACNARLLIQASSMNSKQTTLAGYTQTTMSLLNHAPAFGNRLEDNFFRKSFSSLSCLIWAYIC